MAPAASIAPVILHTVTPFDSRFLFALATDPTVRAQSLDPHPPTWPEHERWLQDFLVDKNAFGWVVLYEHEPAAFVRILKCAPLGVKLSVAVKAEVRGKGVGTAAIHHATIWAKNRDWGVLASIKPDNLASMRAFEKCGYVRVGPGREADQDVIVYATG